MTEERLFVRILISPPTDENDKVSATNVLRTFALGNAMDLRYHVIFSDNCRASVMTTKILAGEDLIVLNIARQRLEVTLSFIRQILCLGELREALFVTADEQAVKDLFPLAEEHGLRELDCLDVHYTGEKRNWRPFATVFHTWDFDVLNKWLRNRKQREPG